MKTEMCKILFRMFSTQLFCSLSPQERGAVVEAIQIAVAPGHPMSENDRRETRSGLISLPWAWEPSFAPDVTVDRGAVRMSHVEDPQLLGRCVRSVASALPRAETRERLFRVMLALFFADGGGEREIDLLEPVRRGLGISRARGDEILEDLKDELVSLVR